MDGDKDPLLLDEGFSFLIAVRLIKDNWKAVIGKYPTFLIGEIWFDLQDMGSCFGPIFRGCHQGPITSTRPASFNHVSWAWESGPARLFFKPNQLPPTLGYGEREQRLYRFLDQT